MSEATCNIHKIKIEPKYECHLCRENREYQEDKEERDRVLCGIETDPTRALVGDLVEALRKISEGESDDKFKENIRGLSEEAFYESQWEYAMDIAKEALSKATSQLKEKI